MSEPATAPATPAAPATRKLNATELREKGYRDGARDARLGQYVPRRRGSKNYMDGYGQARSDHHKIGPAPLAKAPPSVRGRVDSVSSRAYSWSCQQGTSQEEPKMTTNGSISAGMVVRDRKWGGTCTGTVVNVEGDSIFVQWHGTCVEDQLHAEDVELCPEVPNPPENGLRMLTVQHRPATGGRR